MIHSKWGVPLTKRIEDIRRLSEFFGITGITLNDLGSDPREAEELFAQIRACETLISIKFDMHTTARPIIEIFLSVFYAHGLQRLALCCYLEENGLAQQLAQWLPSLSNLEELNLRIVPQQGSRGPALEIVLSGIGECKKMESLHLSDMQIKDNDLERMMRAWLRLKLKRLDLTNNCLSAMSIKGLVQNHCQLSEVRLSGNPLGFLGVEFLKPTFWNLKILLLKNTNIGRTGVLVLAENADRLLNLEHLDISDNGINAEAGFAIEQLLKQCKALKHLDVRSNSLGSAVNAQMNSAIASCATLRYINLRRNNLSDGQVDNFYEFVRTLPREMEFQI